jgi:hypothetical protein
MAGVSPARSRSPYHDRLMARSSPAQNHNPPIDPASPSRNRSSPPIDPTGVVQRTPIEPSGRCAESIAVAVSAFAVPSVITGGAGETVVCSLVSGSNGSSGLHIAKEGDCASNKIDIKRPYVKLFPELAILQALEQGIESSVSSQMLTNTLVNSCLRELF